MDDRFIKAAGRRPEGEVKMPGLTNIEKARMKWKATPAFLRKRVNRHIVKKKISMPPGFEQNIIKARKVWKEMPHKKRVRK